MIKRIPRPALLNTFEPAYQALISCMKNYFLFIATIIVLLNSCTIEKRRYTGGYHVDWIKNTGEVQNRRTPMQVEKTELDLSRNNQTTPPDSSDQIEASLNRQKDQEPRPSEDAAISINKTITSKTKKGLPEIQIKSILPSHPYAGEKPQATDAKDDETVSILSIISMVCAIIATIILLVAMTLLSGWVALGYIVMSVVAFSFAVVFGTLALIIDKSKAKKLSLAFYILFVLSCIISLWVWGGLILSKAGVI
jgi:hypothetical protein